jgi:ABC-2 type transport system ATP-binding protein
MMADQTKDLRSGEDMVEHQLTVRDLRKTFNPGLFEKKRQVLKGVSLEVRRGEIFGFLGPNGAGKTTTIKAIMGLIFPDSGEIRVCGGPHTSLEAKRKLGFMPENPYFYQHLKGGEFLRFYAKLIGLHQTEIEGRIDGVLAMVSMSSHANTAMRTYSKGMLQRVALAQALLGTPELLILDEPMSGLDPVGRRDVRDIILEQKGLGTTVFFSSHIIPDVETICDRVAILTQGKVRAVGEVRDIVTREAAGYEVTFTGAEPEGLKTPVVSSNRAGDIAWVRVEAARRDALTEELAAMGARLVSLTPVRSTLEDFLLRHYEEAGP